MKNLKTLILIFAAIAFIQPSISAAQSNNNKPMPPYVKLLADQGVQVRYIGKGLGLDTWLTAKDGRVQYIYVTPNGEANIVGVLIDKKGNLITTQQLSTYADENPEAFQSIVNVALGDIQREAEVAESQDAQSETNETALVATEEKPEIDAQPVQEPAPTNTGSSDSPAERLYAEIENTNWFEIGNPAAPLVYAVIDPDCTHCHRFVDLLRENGAYENGQIKTRLVPVGIMSGDALYRAGTLLSLPNKQDTFFAHIDGDETALPVDKSATLSGVTKNMSFLQKWNMDVTPFLVYRAKDGSLKIVRGVPKDMDAFLKDIAKNG